LYKNLHPSLTFFQSGGKRTPEIQGNIPAIETGRHQTMGKRSTTGKRGFDSVKTAPNTSPKNPGSLGQIQMGYEQMGIRGSKDRSLRQNDNGPRRPSSTEPTVTTKRHGLKNFTCPGEKQKNRQRMLGSFLELKVV